MNKKFVYQVRNNKKLPNFTLTSRFIAYFSVQKRPPGFVQKTFWLL